MKKLSMNLILALLAIGCAPKMPTAPAPTSPAATATPTPIATVIVSPTPTPSVQRYFQVSCSSYPVTLAYSFGSSYSPVTAVMASSASAVTFTQPVGEFYVAIGYCPAGVSQLILYIMQNPSVVIAESLADGPVTQLNLEGYVQ